MTAATFTDHRLAKLFLRDTAKWATLDEYAQAAGVDVLAVSNALEPHRNGWTVGLEMHNGTVFVYPSPRGRPSPDGYAELTPNLWELLRRRNTLATSWTLWRTIRDMERKGWDVGACERFGVPPRVPHAPETTGIAATVGQTVADVIVEPDLERIRSGYGILSEHQRCGSPAVVSVVPAGMLAPHLAAVRSWMLTVRDASLTVVLCERSIFQPIIVRPDDRGIPPLNVEVA